LNFKIGFKTITHIYDLAAMVQYRWDINLKMKSEFAK